MVNIPRGWAAQVRDENQDWHDIHIVGLLSASDDGDASHRCDVVFFLASGVEEPLRIVPSEFVRVVRRS